MRRLSSIGAGDGKPAEEAQRGRTLSLFPGSIAYVSADRRPDRGDTCGGTELSERELSGVRGKEPRSFGGCRPRSDEPLSSANHLVFGFEIALGLGVADQPVQIGARNAQLARCQRLAAIVFTDGVGGQLDFVFAKLLLEGAIGIRPRLVKHLVAYFLGQVFDAQRPSLRNDDRPL